MKLKHRMCYDVSDDAWHLIAWKGRKIVHVKLVDGAKIEHEALHETLARIELYFDSPNYPGRP